MDTATLNQDLQSPLDLFYHWEKTKPDTIFLRQPKGDTWKTLTYAEAGQEARKMAAALQTMNLQKGDHIGILSKNCYHWILADLAIMIGGFVSVPYYASLPTKQLEEVLNLSDVKALFVGKLDKWGNKIEALSADLKIIKFPHYEGNAKIDVGENWDDLISSHAPIEGNEPRDLDELWTILFTSGTTGRPKGVMHSFRNPALLARIEKTTNFIGVHKMKNQRFFSYLPLNHVGERIGVELNCLTVGGSISFAESIETFAKNIQGTQPSLLFGVPRIWTKFYLGVLAKMPEKKLNTVLKIPILSKIIKKKLTTALGLSEIEIAATGAAITPGFLKTWYKKLGIHLIEAYGMTEVCGSISNSPQEDAPYDSVGVAVPYCELKIHPETQEILMKAPYQMLGYYKSPDKTAEVIQDGWIHSGDRGTLDENGYLRVIGRVKDAFKTSKGSYIVPNPMEEILAENDCIENVCVVGLGCPAPLAIVNLSEIGVGQNKTEIETSLNNAVQKINAELSNYNKISTIIIDKETWSEDNRILTPTLKVRRPRIDELYGNLYSNWHEEKSKVIWK